MNGKYLLLFALTLPLAVWANTESDQNVLRARAAREAQWQTVSVTIPGLRGSINGFLTDDGKTKLDFMDGQIQADTQISSSEFKRYRDQAQYLSECAANVDAYPAYRALNNAYDLSLPIVGAQSAALATKFAGIEYFKVQVAAKSDALMLKSGDIDTQSLGQALTVQLQNQKAKVEGSSQVHLDLTGLDDVVCDLIAGNVTISVEARTHYAAAKL